jgi:hypothetical protein
MGLTYHVRDMLVVLEIERAVGRRQRVVRLGDAEAGELRVLLVVAVRIVF